MICPLFHFIQIVISSRSNSKCYTESLYDFIVVQMTLVFGLYPIRQPNYLQLQVIKLSEIDYVAPDFKKSYKLYVYQLMYRLENKIEVKRYYQL